MKTCRTVCAILGAALAVFATDESAGTPNGQKTFVSCPIVRDTKTVPCWLAEFEGETYYLGIQQDQAAAFQPPQLEHQVLVEGSVKAGPRICGGVVLDPVRISVLPELDQACRTILPAIDEYTVPFAVRGPGPNVPSTRAAGRPPIPAPPQPPFAVREFTLYYDFNAERAGRSARIITDAMTYAKAAHARSVEITGYRAAVRLSNGTDLVEYPWIAEHRAQIMAQTLREIGVPQAAISANWKDEPETGTGMDAYRKRRLTIRITPE
jgi:hypothetical protein